MAGSAKVDVEQQAEESFKRYHAPVELYNALQERQMDNPICMQRNLSYIHKTRRQRPSGSPTTAPREALTASLTLKGQWRTREALGSLAQDPTLANAVACGTGTTSVVVALGIGKSGGLPTSPLRFFPLAASLQHLSVVPAPPAGAGPAEEEPNGAVYLTTAPHGIRIALPADTPAAQLSLLFLVRGGHPDAVFPQRQPPKPLCGMLDNWLFGMLPNEGQLLWGLLPLSDLQQAPQPPLPIPMLPAQMHVYKTVAGTEYQRYFPCNEVEIGLWPCVPRGEDSEVQVAHACSLSLAAVCRKPAPPRTTPVVVAEPAFGANKNFHYMYFQDSRSKTECTENNTCPLCLIKCGSTNGLRHHVEAYHDQFIFSQGQNKTDIIVKCRDDVYDAAGNYLMTDAAFFDYPLHKEFVFQSKSKYGRSAVVPERDTAKLRASLPPQPPWGLRRADWTDPAKRSTAHPGERRAAAHTPPQEAAPKHHKRAAPRGGAAGGGKKRRGEGAASSRPPTSAQGAAAAAAAERSKHARKTKEAVKAKPAHPLGNPRAAQQASGSRVYYHARTAQRLTADELAADVHSDDDADFAEFVTDDRNEIDDFVDVAPEEKAFMHLWNVFVQRHPIYCDSYTATACVVFAREHRAALTTPALRRCLVLHLTHLWEFGVLPPPQVDRCLRIVDGSERDVDINAISAS